MSIMPANRNQNAGTRSCAGLKTMRSVTTTMKIDIEGYAIITSITDSGMPVCSSTSWMTNTQASAASASAVMRPSRTTLD